MIYLILAIALIILFFVFVLPSFATRGNPLQAETIRFVQMYLTFYKLHSKWTPKDVNSKQYVYSRVIESVLDEEDGGENGVLSNKILADIKKFTGEDITYRDVVRHMLIREIAQHHEEYKVSLPPVVTKNLELFERCAYLATVNPKEVGKALENSSFDNKEELALFIKQMEIFVKEINQIPSDY